MNENNPALEQTIDAAVEEAVEEALEGAIEEAVEEAVEEAKTSFWKKLQTGAMMVIAFMISAGQWNDTTEVVSNLWYVVMANFTHELEYEKIESVNVGNSLGYVQMTLGEPHVIKQSQIDPMVTFHYYTEEKFDLTLFTKGERVVGYSVYSKDESFQPEIPFSGTLGVSTLAGQHEIYSSYHFDSYNLTYFLERQEIENKRAFLHLVQGYVEYAAVMAPGTTEEKYRKELNRTISELDDKAAFAESDEALSDVVGNIRKNIYPNYFSVAEISSEIIAESLLSRFEYQMYTKS